MIYFTILHWLVLGFFVILFIILSILSAQAKSTNVVISGIFASFLVSVFGAGLSIVVLEKYTKKGEIIKLKTRRILFNESLFVSGMIKNVGRYPFKYCKVSIKLINQDRKRLKKANFFESAGLNIFGGKKEKKKARPNTIFKEKKFTFKPVLKPGYIYPFSMTLKYPAYFRDTLIIKKIYCH
ncbi:MAG: DUF2393 domain-containing protein [Epsilonproteobacteria bacterium]|nr:DUF2393 domain-containing protein [Campylobacterota bacterium]